MPALDEAIAEEEARGPGGLRERPALILAVSIGLFTFYTVATGAFEGTIQRGVFVALVAALAVCLYPLEANARWRPLGIAVD